MTQREKNNTAVGYKTGISNIVGNNNTFLGNSADCGSNNLNNSTAIGYKSKITKDNQIVLGNSDTTEVFIPSDNASITLGSIVLDKAKIESFATTSDVETKISDLLQNIGSDGLLNVVGVSDVTDFSTLYYNPTDGKMYFQQTENRSKLAILINPNTYNSSDASKFVDLIKDETPSSRHDIFFFENLLTTLEEKYNLGYRFFASPTIGSYSLYTYCVPFCREHPDVLLFNTYSTQYFDNDVLPFNIIRTAVNDKEMTQYIVNNLLYNLNNLSIDNLPIYYNPISSFNNNLPIFSKIVYFYTEKDGDGNPDTYSEEYGNQLESAVNLQNNKITIKKYKITDDNFTLPQILKDLLLENPVSNRFFSSSLKTMFIMNSSSPCKNTKFIR